MGPAVEFADGGFFAFDQHFHRPIGTILHPTTQTKAAGLALSRGAEKYALDSSSDNQLQLFQCHEWNEYSELRH